MPMSSSRRRDFLRAYGIEPELLETAGDPAREIERIADKGKFDAIVVGSRGLDAVTRVLQGASPSTSPRTRRRPS